MCIRDRYSPHMTETDYMTAQGYVAVPVGQVVPLRAVT
jgi:hypothetical protein